MSNINMNAEEMDKIVHEIPGVINDLNEIIGAIQRAERRLFNIRQLLLTSITDTDEEGNDGDTENNGGNFAE